MASERKKSNSKDRSTSARRVETRPRKPVSVANAPAASERARAPKRHFAICIRNEDYPASLELRKLYVVLEDPFAAEHQMIRIIDESGEDYLFPDSYFVRVQLPTGIERALRKIA